jgi:hypothetical protein
MALNIKAIRVKVTAKRAAAYMSALPYFNPLMQRPPTICILHGQNKAKNEIFDGQIPEQRPGTHRSRVWKMVFEMGI